MTEQLAEKPEKPEKPKQDKKNGVVRPKSGTKTGRVWEIADAQSAELAKPAPRKGVLAECVADDINPATAATQYGRWRKYHGLEGRGNEEETTTESVAPDKAKTEAQGEVVPQTGVE